MRRFPFAILAALVAATVSAGTLDSLDGMLLRDDLDPAAQQIKEMFLSKSIVTGRDIATLRAYEKVLGTLQSAKAFDKAARDFHVSEKTQEDFSRLNVTFSQFHQAWAALPPSVPVSAGLIAHLNDINEESRRQFALAKSEHQIAETQREKISEEQRARQQQQREELERAARLAATDAETKEEARERSLEAARDAKLKVLNDAAVKAGYKGINTKYGIAGFLYTAAKRGSLELGLNQVFWVKLTPRDQLVDEKWRLTQVVDGWELYEITDWDSKELIRLSIAVRAAAALPIEGQKLKADFYAFRGNMQFRTVDGATRIVQRFDPVDLQ